MSLKALDVAIGLVFLFLMVTFVASASLEIVSSVFKWRARMLREAIGNMLEHSRMASVSDIYDSPLVLGLSRTSVTRTFLRSLQVPTHGQGPKVGLSPAQGAIIPVKVDPSYIPAATFAAAILQAIMSRAASPVDPAPEAVIREIKAQLSTRQATNYSAPTDALASVLEVTLATQGASIQAVRLAIEKWFNDTMERVSGWYKRRTQGWLMLLGLLMAFGCNIDTVGVARWLWQGDSARQSVVAVATDYAKATPPPAPSTNKDSQNKDGQKNVDQNQLPSQLARIIDFDRQAAALQYPIGWRPGDIRDRRWFLQYLSGALLTAIAISMGSTFWFDALSNLVKLRGAGPKPVAS